MAIIDSLYIPVPIKQGFCSFGGLGVYDAVAGVTQYY